MHLPMMGAVLFVVLIVASDSRMTNRLDMSECTDPRLPIHLSTRYIIQSNDVTRVRQLQENDVTGLDTNNVNDVILWKGLL